MSGYLDPYDRFNDYERRISNGERNPPDTTPAPEFIFGNGVTAIQTGETALLLIPSDWLLREVTAFTAETSGSITFDVLRSPWGTTLSFTSMVGAATPGIANAATANGYSDTVLTDWVTDGYARDVIQVTVTAVTTLKNATCALVLTRITQPPL